MIVPNFNGIEKGMLFPGVLMGVDNANQTLKQMCRFYLEVLDGDPELRIPAGDLINAVIHMEGVIADVSAKKLTVNIIDPDVLGVLVENVYKDGHWMILVKFDFIAMSVMYADFLVSLKKKHTEVFRVVRDCLQGLTVCSLSPVSTVENIYDYFASSGIFDEALERGDDETEKDMQKELNAFRKYLPCGKRLSRKNRKYLFGSIQQRFKRLSSSLSEAQRSWVSDLIEIHELSRQLQTLKFAGYEDFEEIHSYSYFDQHCEVQSFFVVLWDRCSFFTEYFAEEMHYRAQSVTEPIECVYVKTKEDFESVMKFTRFISLIQRVLYRAEEVWDDNDKSCN